ncbi:MAG: hypothetical protein K1X94_37075 [Sandaracinaceae bacterium]|nr:hypothetical protein [Sandaracinaceae bacterium]
MDVDDLDLKSADESDLTEQAPPVAMRELAQTVRERMPVPQPSPARVPEPHRDPPVEHAPARHAPERAPMIPHAPERMPAPQPSPEPRVRAEGTSDALARVRERRSDSFTPSLDRPQRDSALERLRARKS